MNSNYDFLDWLGEQAAMEIGNLVQYARKGRVSSQFFMGREYPWDPKMNAFGRWVTNVGGGKYFIRFEEVVDRAKNKNKPTDEAFAVLIGSRPNVNKRKELLENMRYHEFFVRKELSSARAGNYSRRRG